MSRPPPLVVRAALFAPIVALSRPSARAQVEARGSAREQNEDLVEVRPCQARDLRIDVGVDASGQERIAAEVDAPDGVRGAECHLLGLGEEVVRTAIQHQLADWRERHRLFGDELVPITPARTDPSRVHAIGLKAARIESNGVPMFRYRYFRVAYVGLIRGAGMLFRSAIYARQRRASEDSLTIDVSWV